MMKNWLAAGAVALSVGMATTAQAAFVTQPGEQVGLALGAPLPEGVYAVNTFSWGQADAAGAPYLGVNIPVLVWSTGYKIFGANIQPVIAVPSVFIHTDNAFGPNREISTFYNPFVGSFFAWDLGNNIGASYLVGAYINFGDRGSLFGGGFAPNPLSPTGLSPIGTPVLGQLASSTLRNGVSLSYTGEGYNLTATFTYNHMIDDVAFFGGPVGRAIGPVGNADHVYLDLTATKKFGKFEIGAVAYGYTDLPVNRNNPVYANYVRGGLFAVGGLIGYDWGAFTTQFMITREVANRQFRGEETRGWIRIIAPLYTPPAPAVVEAPLVRKY